MTVRTLRVNSTEPSGRNSPLESVSAPSTASTPKCIDEPIVLEGAVLQRQHGIEFHMPQRRKRRSRAQRLHGHDEHAGTPQLRGIADCRHADAEILESREAQPVCLDLPCPALADEHDDRVAGSRQQGSKYGAHGRLRR